MKHHNNTPSRLAKLAGLAGLTAGILASVGSMSAATFTNGDFETNSFAGWSQGSGTIPYGTFTNNLNVNDFYSGGSYYNTGANASAVVSSFLDPLTDNHLNSVYSGKYSARVNDSNNNYSVSVIRQTVVNYTDPNIYFAWAAVLQDSHDTYDSDVFALTLRDDTTGTNLYSVTYNSASADTAALFTESTSGWFYTDWQVQNLDVSALAGHTFTLSLLAADCPYGGHAGYVYLDGFGAEIPQQGPETGAVPEPSTYGLMGAAALLGAVVYRRRRGKKQQAVQA
ncbi:MAG: PEP-CTERM sorting domain-containing protein [Nibricoccus sp.]